MRLIDIQQGSSEWLAIRHEHITSTDSAAICGLNPWTPPNKLWKLKTKRIPPEPCNEKMKRGQLLEPKARDELSDLLKMPFNPIVAVHDKEWWAMASLDGIDGLNETICEIKCGSLKLHQQALDGIIPEYYACQIQHHLWVTGCYLCYYVSYFPEHKKPLVVLDLVYDENFIEQMIAKEHKFYFTNLMQDIEPEEWSFKTKMEIMK